MIKGDKIKLVKPMGAFTNVGEICEVIDVAEGGVISFKFGNGRHLGCMSYDEYLKYFEPVIEPVKPKRVWTNWKIVKFTCPDINGEPDYYYGLCRHNGKKVQVKIEAWNLIAEASCHYDDEFDFQTGLDLATKRLAVKILDYKVEAMAKEM